MSVSSIVYASLQTLSYNRNIASLQNQSDALNKKIQAEKNSADDIKVQAQKIAQYSNQLQQIDTQIQEQQSLVSKVTTTPQAVSVPLATLAQPDRGNVVNLTV